jgi:hypothetical protein
MANPLKTRLLIVSGVAALTAAGTTAIALAPHGSAAPASIRLAAAVSTPSTTQTPANEAAETPGAAEAAGTEAPEAPEAPGTPDVGHADDANNPNVDYQFDGQQ